jgi:lipoate-protein ligase A
MSTPAASNVIRLVRTRGLCVLRQLRLEESLFRANDENWAIVNDGAPRRAIVLGISGKPHRLINVAAAHEDDVLVIKRFTGGGTVVVDADTQFVSLVMNGDAIPNVPLFPRPLMRWTGDLYGGVVGTNDDSGVFRDLPNWRLHQDDYVVETRSELKSDMNDRATSRDDRVDVSETKSFLMKVGGNAQSISKTRFVHHTSFLWDFDIDTMKKYLTVPEKQPAYRENRSHGAFLAPLSRWIEDRNALRDRLPGALRARGLVVREASLADAEAAALEAEAGKPNESGRRTRNFSLKKSTAVVDLERALTMDADARAPTLPQRH